jgi:hypothetical protein
MLTIDRLSIGVVAERKVCTSKEITPAQCVNPLKDRICLLSRSCRAATTDGAMAKKSAWR